jgi:hypothetical protein
MGESNITAKEIDLGKGFGDVAVKANGIRVELHADGSVAAYTQKDVDAYTNGAVHVHPPANDDVKAEPSAAPRIGDKMPDGSVYAGTSPDTGKAMYATPKDAPLTYTFNKAKEYAANLNAYGHQDWHVPTKSELNVLFQNRAAIGGFDISGSYPAGWYWSSSQLISVGARDQRFSDGDQGYLLKYNDSSLRCVR